MSPPAAVIEQRLAVEGGAILFDAARIPQADPALLDTARWPQGESRGRAAVHRVQGEFGAAILRPYRRGGLVARFNEDRYLWTGEAGTRAFREFRLLAELRRRELPVPAPLMAGYRRQGLWYRANLLTGEIVGAATLAASFRYLLADTGSWSQLGETLARFHAAGVCHADLNAHNLLIDGDCRWWLIDFDRGYLRNPDIHWPRTRLARLQRSLRKLGAETLADWPQAWRALCEAHDRALAATAPSAQ